MPRGARTKYVQPSGAGGHWKLPLTDKVTTCCWSPGGWVRADLPEYSLVSWEDGNLGKCNTVIVGITSGDHCIVHVLCLAG